MILLYSEPEDRPVDIVEANLRARGVDVVRFDGADFPVRVTLSIELPSRGPGSATLTIAGRRIDLADVSAIWDRRPQKPEPHPQLSDPQVRAFAAGECSAVLSDLWMCYGGTFFPGRPDRMMAAHFKTWQLQMAARVGFEIPATLVTNEPRAFFRFARAQDGHLISKLAHGVAFDRAFEARTRFTDALTMRDFAYARSIRHCPAAFQSYVRKDVELRVTVVGQRVFAAEIRSQASQRAQHDWRRYDFGNTPHAVHRLPEPIERQCVALVEALGLHFGAIDLIRTPEGEYVFLEINPNGQYLWLEDLTGLPISAAIADFLADLDRVGSVPAQAARALP